MFGYVAITFTDEHDNPTGGYLVPDTADCQELIKQLRQEAEEGKLMGLPLVVDKKQ